MDPLIERYARRAAPRYTSYPTAPHFQPGFPAETYAGWLAALDPAEPVSLYLHVPFCRQMCWYCGCNMKLVTREGPLEAYARMLMAEIDLVASALPDRLTVGHLHWGGGTPTALRPAQISAIMDRLHARFDLAPDAEIAVESDPRTLTEALADTLAAIGTTRASFGVQEFDAQVQRTINRVQPPEMVRAAVEMLRARGIAGINFDLIYGLPHQTVTTLLRTVDIAAELAPDRVALFGYAHVPWMAKNQRMIPTEALPSAWDRIEQAARAADALVAAGYRAIGIDHFARPDDGLAQAARAHRLRRNFQGYTDDQSETLIGLGATSIGRTPQGYVQSIAETGAWARAVEAGTLPVGKGLAFAGEDRLRAAVIERIMCDGAADLDALGRAHGARPGWADGARADLAEPALDGLVEVSETGVRLTERGRPLARVVASAFDAYLERGTARHSIAV